MSHHGSSSHGRGGIGPLGWVLVGIVVLFLFGWLISLVFGLVGLILTAVIKAIGAIFAVIFGVVGGVLGIIVSFSTILLLLVPGIIIGVLIARALSRRKG